MKFLENVDHGPKQLIRFWINVDVGMRTLTLTPEFSSKLVSRL